MSAVCAAAVGRCTIDALVVCVVNFPVRVEQILSKLSDLALLACSRCCIWGLSWLSLRQIAGQCLGGHRGRDQAAASKRIYPAYQRVEEPTTKLTIGHLLIPPPVFTGISHAGTFLIEMHDVTSKRMSVHLS